MLEARDAIQPAHLVSFIDGKPYKTLKRHITRHGMTVAEYLEKYGLPKDYPMVARNTSLLQTATALRIGLGRKAAPAPVPAQTPAKAPKAPRAKRQRVIL